MTNEEIRQTWDDLSPNEAFEAFEATEWNYVSLHVAMDFLQGRIVSLRQCNRGCETDDLHHAIRFIEYNMKEMEIDGGNGD